jgi:hypothetical protein
MNIHNLKSIFSRSPSPAQNINNNPQLSKRGSAFAGNKAESNSAGGNKPGSPISSLTDCLLQQSSLTSPSEDISGLCYINALQACNLGGINRSTNIYPVLHMSVGSYKKSSIPIRADRNPFFNEEFEFLLPNHHCLIHISIMDSSAGVLIGEADLPIYEYKPQILHTLDVKLNNQDASINIKFAYEIIQSYSNQILFNANKHSSNANTNSNNALKEANNELHQSINIFYNKVISPDLVILKALFLFIEKCSDLSQSQIDKLLNAILTILIHSSLSLTLEFIEYGISRELLSVEDNNSLFRRNTPSCKILSAFTLNPQIGRNYLHSILGPFITQIIELDHNLEIDPSRGQVDSIDHRQKELSKACQLLLDNIIGSLDKVPTSLKYVANALKRLIKQKYNNTNNNNNNYSNNNNNNNSGSPAQDNRRSSDLAPAVEYLASSPSRSIGLSSPSSSMSLSVEDRCNDAVHNSLASFFFLRYLCPALVTPVHYGIINKPPPNNSLRTLMLLGKVIQSLANTANIHNLSTSGVEIVNKRRSIDVNGSLVMKEAYMQSMMPIIQSNITNVANFLDKITQIQSIQTAIRPHIITQDNNISNNNSNSNNYSNNNDSERKRVLYSVVQLHSFTAEHLQSVGDILRINLLSGQFSLQTNTNIDSKATEEARKLLDIARFRLKLAPYSQESKVRKPSNSNNNEGNSSEISEYIREFENCVKGRSDAASKNSGNSSNLSFLDSIRSKFSAGAEKNSNRKSTIITTESSANQNISSAKKLSTISANEGISRPSVAKNNLTSVEEGKAHLDNNEKTPSNSSATATAQNKQLSDDLLLFKQEALQVQLHLSNLLDEKQEFIMELQSQNASLAKECKQLKLEIDQCKAKKVNENNTDSIIEEEEEANHEQATFHDQHENKSSDEGEKIDFPLVPGLSTSSSSPAILATSSSNNSSLTKKELELQNSNLLSQLDTFQSNQVNLLRRIEIMKKQLKLFNIHSTQQE